MNALAFTAVFCLLSVLSSFENDLNQWGNRLLLSSDNFFASAYEQYIFDKFSQKFARVELEDISTQDKIRILDIGLLNNRIRYRLYTDIDASSKITGVFRGLDNIPVRGSDHADPAIRKWLGKFFYRLDTGDSAAIRDMIFYNNIRIQYKQEESKGNVISSLLHDFPQIIQPAKIQIEKNQNKYVVRISNNFLTNLLLEIPESQMIHADSEELQKILYQRLLSSLDQSQPGESQTIKDHNSIIKKVVDAYPGTKLIANEISVPYPFRRIKILKELIYEIESQSSEQSSRIPFQAKINLRHNSNRSTITLNDVLPISYYLAPGSGPASIPLIAQSIRFNYALILPVCKPSWFVNNGQIFGSVNYRGYKPQMLNINSAHNWCQFWQTLQQEGTLYYYPSLIDEDVDKLVIKGLLYILNSEDAHLYHFAEIKTHYSKKENRHTHITITLYPYLSTANLGQ